MGYRIKKKDYHLACARCLCMRCGAVNCPYNQLYNCYPSNAGCVHCLQTERNEPLLECEFFKPYKTMSVTYKIKCRRKNPYYNIARLLQSLHSEFKKL